MNKLSLSIKVFIGFALGIILGLIFKDKVLVIKPIGDIFLNLIKMIVAPLVFASIVSSIASLENMAKLRKMGGKVLAFYVGTTLIAALIGLGLANFVAPGNGFEISQIVAGATPVAPKEGLSFGQTVVSMIPSNPFKSLVDTNLIQIIVFSVFLGTAITSQGEKAKTFRNIFQEGAELMYKITGYVMAFSPYGVLALMACTVGQYGLEIFGPLGKFVGTLYFGGIVILVILYVPMLKFIGKVSIKHFFKSILKVVIMTISTTSSAGTMPVTLHTVKEDFKVKSELADFAIPLGTTINMNGAVLFYSMAVVFISQIYGISLGFDKQLTLVLLASVIAIGSPGIPGGGIVMTMVLLNYMGLPLEIMGLIAGVYRLFDMCNTTLNVVGDVVSTVCVARTENMIDDDILVQKTA